MIQRLSLIVQSRGLRLEAQGSGLTLVAVLTLVVALTPSLGGTLLAQWPNHRSARTPRTADGRTDLAGAPPRPPDRQGDL